jgi:hypothetical protein
MRLARNNVQVRRFMRRPYFCIAANGKLHATGLSPPVARVLERVPITLNREALY